MRFSAVVAALIPVGAVYATTFTVSVGENNGITYDPTSVTAQVGDTIAFNFLAKNHTVTQSTFAAPCVASGIDSGFQAANASTGQVPQWSFTLDNDTAPLWFFCRQTGHCEGGMVFAVNPTAEKTFAQFQANAMGTGNTTASAASSAAGTAATVSAASAGSSGAAAATTAGGASAATSGFTTVSTSTATSSGAASASSTGAANGALRMSGSGASSILAILGLTAGLML